MTPKEKAKELIKTYINIQKSINKKSDFSYEYAKEFALESIIFRISDCEEKMIKYWKEVKQEIKKL